MDIPYIHHDGLTDSESDVHGSILVSRATQAGMPVDIMIPCISTQPEGHSNISRSERSNAATFPFKCSHDAASPDGRGAA
jgi:hypothetical protein